MIISRLLCNTLYLCYFFGLKFGSVLFYAFSMSVFNFNDVMLNLSQDFLHQECIPSSSRCIIRDAMMDGIADPVALGGNPDEASGGRKPGLFS